MNNSTQTITPFLWFDKQAEDAINFYTSTFKNSNIQSIKRYPEGPLEEPMKGMEGKILTGVFQLAGQTFMALDGGPHSTLTPAVSFMVICETEAGIDEVWQQLSKGGKVMMELDKYDWSDKYGWVEDQYGISWQLYLGKLEDVGQKIVPTLMFSGPQAGKAEEAINHYTSVFENSNITGILHYNSDNGPEGTVQHAQFTLNDYVFMAMDSPVEQPFTFTEAISFYIHCQTQEQIDYYWGKLSANPEAEQCGWLKDKYGLSWLIPEDLPKMLNDPDKERADQVMQTMLQMKKIEIEDLRKAYELKTGVK